MLLRLFFEGRGRGVDCAQTNDNNIGKYHSIVHQYSQRRRTDRVDDENTAITCVKMTREAENRAWFALLSNQAGTELL